MYGLSFSLRLLTGSILERIAKEGDSPVWESRTDVIVS